MKINSQPPISPATLGPACGPNEWAARLAAAPSATAGGPDAPAAKAEPSSFSRELQEAQGPANAAPEVRADGPANVAVPAVNGTSLAAPGQGAAAIAAAGSPVAASVDSLPPGYGDVSGPDQAYWTARLAESPGPQANTYDAATSLAQWLDVEANGSYLPNASGPGLSILPGTARSPISEEDLRIGLANAQARAAAAGVTDEQLATAKQALAAKLAAGDYAAGGTFGYADPAAEAYSRADYALSGGTPYNLAQLEYINRTGGATVENLTRLLGDPNFAVLR